MSDWSHELRARLSSLRLAPAREAEILEELSQHLDDRRQELIAGGATPETATRLTLEEFSADRLARYLSALRQARVAETAQPPRRWFLLGGLLTDLRDAVRALRREPGFTLTALFVLTLGIGATTAIFSVVDAVVLRGLPFDEHDRLVAVGERGSFGPGKRPINPRGIETADPQAIRGVQPQNYLDWLVQQHVFESMAALSDASPTLRLPGAEPEELVAQRVTASFFDVLRVRPAVGRVFTADDEVDGHHRVAVLSDALWHRRFGANPEIVGRTIPLDDGGYEVVGIMPVGVTYPVGALQPTELWVPYLVPASQRIRGRGFAAYLQVIARLKPGESIAQAQAQMDQVAHAEPLWPAGTRDLDRGYLRRDGLHRDATDPRDWRAHGARRDAVERDEDGTHQRLRAARDRPDRRRRGRLVCERNGKDVPVRTGRDRPAGICCGGGIAVARRARREHHSGAAGRERRSARSSSR